MKQEDFINNIRQKLRSAHLPAAEVEHPGSFTGYSWDANASTDALLEQFKTELTNLTGHVHVLDDVEETAEKILSILEKHKTKRIIAWDNENLGLDNLREVLNESGIEISDSQLSSVDAERKSQLAEIDDVFVGLTGSHGALADVGAIALFSGEERGRLASLAPPVHIALLRREDIYPSMGAFMADQGKRVPESSNLIFIAGPSRTGDIEMTLSIGVHGPGETHVIVLP